MNDPPANPTEGHDGPQPLWSCVFDGREQGNVHAVEAAGGAIWVGCCKRPSLLLTVAPDLRETEPIRFEQAAG